MARGKKELEGQLTFEMCLNSENYVCQANALIGGRQALKLNSAKLIRTAIMQVVAEDKELKPYIITIAELADLLNISASNMYRDIEEITNDIISNPVYIKEETPNKVRWIKIPWVTRCEYHSDIGVALKLNDELKPFLIDLKEHYTQYRLENILAMKSIYAIRLFEMIQERIMIKGILPKEGIEIVISMEEIRECCDCKDKYKSFSNFKARVIDVAENEINRVTYYYLDHTYIKEGKRVVGLKFYFNTKSHIEGEPLIPEGAYIPKEYR